MALAALALTAFSAITQIASGRQQQKAYNQEADLQKQQGDVAAREAGVNAENEAYNQTQAVQNQRLAYLANGVSLEGSPAAVLEASKKYGQNQVQSVLDQGAARKTLAYNEATITRNKGRTALLAGITGAVSTTGSGAVRANEAGMFDPLKKKGS